MENTEILEQLRHNQNRQEEINDLMTVLPKGHINILYRGSRGYYYLTYRNGKKINNDYLGPVGKADLTEIMQKLKQREELKKELKALKEEEKQLKKKTLKS